MWKISKSFEFNYGHRIATQQLNEEFSLDEPCKCRFLHGHTASIEVTLQSEKLDEGGMVTDFYHLTWLKEWIDKNIDHKFIIDINDPLMKIWFGDFKKDPTFIKRTDGMGCVFDVGGNTGVDVVASFDAWQDAKQKGDQNKNLESMDEKSKLSEYYESIYCVDFPPTSECLAKWIYDFVEKKMKPLEVEVTSVTWYESPKSKSVYSKQ